MNHCSRVFFEYDVPALRRFNVIYPPLRLMRWFLSVRFRTKVAQGAVWTCSVDEHEIGRNGWKTVVKTCDFGWVKTAFDYFYGTDVNTVRFGLDEEFEKLTEVVVVVVAADGRDGEKTRRRRVHVKIHTGSITCTRIVYVIILCVYCAVKSEMIERRPR